MSISDPNTTNLVYATWAVAIATIIGIIITTVLTKKSLSLTRVSLETTKDELVEIRRANALAEQQLRITQKPKLELIKSQSSLQGRENDYHLKLFYTIKNSGTVPMRKIVRWSFPSNNNEIIHIIKDWNSVKNQYHKLGTIRHGDSLELMEKMPLVEKRGGSNWIVCFEYEYLSTKEKTVIVFPNISAGQEPVPNRIIPNEDIIEAEKRLDDERAGNISAPT